MYKQVLREQLNLIMAILKKITFRSALAYAGECRQGHKKENDAENGQYGWPKLHTEPHAIFLVIRVQ